MFVLVEMCDLCIADAKIHSSSLINGFLYFSFPRCAMWLFVYVFMKYCTHFQIAKCQRTFEQIEYTKIYLNSKHIYSTIQRIHHSTLLSSIELVLKLSTFCVGPNNCSLLLFDYTRHLYVVCY